MTDRLKTLTDAEIRILQRMIDREKRQTINAPQVFDHSDRGDDQQAPETYVARVPSTGIPELDVAYGSSEDEPGSAECYIYQIIGGPETPRFIQVGTLLQRVYNVFPSTITGDAWLPITRDKFGKWIALAGGTSSGPEIVNFRVLATCPGLDASIGNRCPCVQAEVTRVLCVSSVRKGDLITVWDIDSCWFNIPLDLLIDRKGTAFLMLVGDDDNGQVNCSGYGAIRPGECFWSVESLCCAEESYSS